jgi:hypothetical protein
VVHAHLSVGAVLRESKGEAVVTPAGIRISRLKVLTRRLVKLEGNEKDNNFIELDPSCPSALCNT